MKFRIYVGLGGSFGGAEYTETIEAIDRDDAVEYAYEMAVEEYQSYEGTYGILSIQDIIDEFTDDEVDYTDDDVEERYADEVNQWIEYFVVGEDEDYNEYD